MTFQPIQLIAKTLIDSFSELPIWIKQVIYLEITKELKENHLLDTMENMNPEDTIAFFLPKISALGEHQLNSQKDDIGKLLLGSKNRYTVLDLCIHHKWTLSHACGLVLEAITLDWIYPPNSTKAMGTIEYLANQIRLGEFLVKMGRITDQELDQALRTQHYIKEALQEHTGIANILINLGYITRQDTEGILVLKEESVKPLAELGLIQLIQKSAGK